jgi:hypothetical protein
VFESGQSRTLVVVLDREVVPRHREIKVRTLITVREGTERAFAKMYAGGGIALLLIQVCLSR